MRITSRQRIGDSIEPAIPSLSNLDTDSVGAYFLLLTALKRDLRVAVGKCELSKYVIDCRGD